MKAGAGKAKGGAFEREVCKRLSLWLSQGQRNDLMWRSAMSGGRATLQFNLGKVNRTQSGDVSAIDREAYAFCQRTFVECKSYKDLSIARGFVCETGTLFNFWRTACREAEKYDKRPLLIARQNLYPTLAITRMADSIFDREPLIVLNNWQVSVYRFDDATRVVVARRFGRAV
jgi:hypothetical protein